MRYKVAAGWAEGQLFTECELSVNNFCLKEAETDCNNKLARQ